MDWRDWDEPRGSSASALDFGSLRDALLARKWRLIGTPLAALALIGAFLMLATPKYRAEAQVFIGGAPDLAFSDQAPSDHGAEAFDALEGQARLLASRDLARRAIKDLGLDEKPEFDPAAQGLGPLSRALVFLGLARDPARMSQEERILKSYEDRLSVEAPRGTSLVAIAFQSEDRELAANAANKVADLYLEMRAAAAPEGDAAPDVRVVSRAIAPERPLFPNEALFFAMSAAAIAVGALAVFSSPPRRRVRIEPPPSPPHALGRTPVFARLENAPTQEGPGPRARQNKATGRVEADHAQAVADIAQRILSMRRGPGHGARIVVTSLALADAAPMMMVALGRLLGREGRSIVVGLDRAHAPEFSQRSVDAGEAPFDAEPGLGDLLSGTASFAEVIHRDPASRLHFVPVAAGEAIDPKELAGALETLARTYDFILLIAPPFDQNDLGKTLAANADFVVLSAPPRLYEGGAGEARAELIECGAREVLVIGLPPRPSLSFGQDAA